MHATTTKPYNIDKKLVYDAYSRSRSSVRSDVCEFPAVGSSIHSSGMPMPFHVTGRVGRRSCTPGLSQNWT
jgi:hypothetical protein